MPERIIELDRGCKLAIDAKLDPNDAVTREIERGIRELMPRVQALIPAHDVVIHVKVTDQNIVPTWGVGGWASDSHTVWIAVKPENPSFKTEFVLRALIHEIHHAVRYRSPHWQRSLLDLMVLDGLADHFQVEVMGGEPPPWTRALTEEEIQQYLIKVKPYLRAKTKSEEEFGEKYHLPWFFGRTGAEPIPMWTGYTLGWRIVENYLRAHPEARASSLVLTPAEVVVSATHELIDSE
jgi:uncharacterized protein YjaZ